MTAVKLIDHPCTTCSFIGPFSCVAFTVCGVMPDLDSKQDINLASNKLNLMRILLAQPTLLKIPAN